MVSPEPSLIPSAKVVSLSVAADSLLTASPDALISRESFPVLGMRWGYSTRAGHSHELHQPALLDGSDWAAALPLLREAFPEWQFKPEWPAQGSTQ